MHECPDCGQACDCDDNDIWSEGPSEMCVHECAMELDEEADFRDSGGWIETRDDSALWDTREDDE